MVVVEMYCREQITIPEQLPLILKKYAKAVIRTQPYDLLRWSAAYFRCLALEQTPPAKLRFEPQQKYGDVTYGYIRTLVEQLGKGYFVQRKFLLNRWQGLCLPEEQLFDILSLCRMLNWSQIHWLKLVAVFIGTLNDNLMNTMKMICEVLTDEPDGSPAPIPLWMFRVCYKFVAELDCSETQCFIDGRKLLPGEILEDAEEPIEVPQVQAAEVLKQLLIDEWNSRMKYDKFTPSEVEGSDAESGIGERPNSSFKFMGNFDDSSEILRRSPDFDAVIMLLQDEIDNIRQVNPAASLEALIKKSQEITIKESAQDETEISLESVKAQRLNILKKIGPPWTWIDKFTDYKCLTESFNFIDSTSGMLEDDDESHEVIVNTMKRRSTSADSSQTIIHYTSDESRSKTFIRDESEEESPSKLNTKSVINQVLSDVMCKLTEAQSNGKCSVRDVRSLTRIIDGEFGSDESAMKLKGFLEKANSNGQDFNDLNELNSYFMSEIVKENRVNVNEDDEEDPNETLKEPDDPDRIVEIFEESGIDVDNKLLEKKVSETMILGLVKKPGTADSLAPPPSDIDVESVKSIQSDDTTTASMAASSQKLQTVTKDENIQTTPYLERQRQKLANENAERQLNENEAEKGDDESYKAIIPPLPGIGPSVSHETTERFLLYLMRRARKQGGMVYPRNWQESECPSMVD